MHSISVQHLCRTSFCLAIALLAVASSARGQSPQTAPSQQSAAPAAPTSGLKDAAEEPLQKGLVAAQQQDWKLAIRYFLEAQKADPDAPQIWFNLGLASSKLPGYELRALAWFQAYLLAVPDGPNTDAIRHQITALEVTFESRLSKIIDGLEALPAKFAVPLEKVTKSADYDISFDAQNSAKALAAARAFFGDPTSALKSLLRADGAGPFCSRSGTLSFDPILDALVAAGQLVPDPTGDEVDKRMSRRDCRLHIGYFLETGDFGAAQHYIDSRLELLTSITYYDWEKTACEAFDRHDQRALQDALSKAQTVAFAKDMFDNPTNDDQRFWGDGLHRPRVRFDVLLFALGERDRARVLAENLFNKFPDSQHDSQLLGLLLALRENIRLTNDVDKFVADEFRSGRELLEDPCTDKRTKWVWGGDRWWGRNRKDYLISLAGHGVALRKCLTLTSNDCSDAGDETQLVGFLQQSKDTLGAPDATASVKLLRSIAESLTHIAEEYRRVHGPYRTDMRFGVKLSAHLRLLECCLAVLVGTTAGASSWGLSSSPAAPSQQSEAPAAPTSGLKDAAKEPFQKGLAAAHQQDWKLAIRYFLDAQKADPDAPRIWFNLGLASSKLPGYELRALAWFQAYLLAVPDAPNADAVRSQIVTLEVAFESRVSKIIDGLESVAQVRMAEGRKAHHLGVLDAVYTTGVLLAASRIFIGDTAGGLKTFRGITGMDWNEVKPDAQCRQEFPETVSIAGLVSRSTVSAYLGYMSDPLLAAGQTFTDTVVVVNCRGSVAYSIEHGDFGFAEQLIAAQGLDSDHLKSAFEQIACAAFDRNDPKTMREALAKVDSMEEPEDRLRLAELMIATHQYDRARALAADVDVKDPRNDSLVLVLVALGDNERADALDKKWADAARSNSYKPNDPCFQAPDPASSNRTGYWWGRSRRAYLVNLALRGVKFQTHKDPVLFRDSVNADDTELTDFLSQTQNMLAASDPLTSVLVARDICHGLEHLVEEYRRAHGPYGR